MRTSPLVWPRTSSALPCDITTGLAENKFGIAMRDMLSVIGETEKLANVKFVGLHFHIGSQILDMGDFEALCNRVNELQDELDRHRIHVEHINVGGGLGVDYAHPNRVPIQHSISNSAVLSSLNAVHSSRVPYI